MKIIRISEEIPQLSENPPTAVAIGNFDGVHLGHNFLIEKLLTAARETAVSPAVCTFDPLPARFFGRAAPMITTLPQRLALIERLGIEICFVLEFNAALASVSPEDFFNKYLFTGFNARVIVVGKDFRFGNGRGGDVNFLSELCASKGILFTAADKIAAAGSCISSSLIRKLAGLGEVKTIPLYLGRQLSVEGTVTEGDRIGRTIGFPTANLRTENELIPAAGVYGGTARLRSKSYDALIYIGKRPTINGDELRVEANILGFSDWDLCGEKICLEFTRKLRGEMRFNSLEELRRQITEDRKLFYEYGIQK
jgi:riboflavin kinase/FMN adenylyltransferase